MRNRNGWQAVLVLVLATVLVAVASAAEITPGTRVTGNLTTVGQLDSYTFWAAGGAATVLMGKIDGTLVPEVRLLDPDGILLTSVWNYGSTTIESSPLTKTGTYTIIARDHFGTNTGPYGLTLVANPGTYEAIQSGETKTGTIAAGELRVYTFWGDANDAATILLGQSSGALVPQVELHSPSGAVLDSTWNYESTTISSVSLPESGVYLIICRDHFGTNAGEYGVSLSKNPGSPNSAQDPDCGPLQSGETKTGTITTADLDAGTFYADAGDAVTVLMGQSSSALVPQLELHSPSGEVLSSTWNYGSTTLFAEALPESGTYFIICRDHFGVNAGEYGVSLIKNPGSTDGGTIGIGETKVGTIDVGDLDGYTFWAYAGDAATLLMARSSGALVPQVELHSPGGELLHSVWNYGSATISSEPLTESGFHVIICRDHFGTNTGGYGVSLSKNPRTHFEDDDLAITYSETWTQYAHPTASAGHLGYSNQTGARAVMLFFGSGIKWQAARGPQMGKARIYLDGSVMGLVDLYRATQQLTLLQKTGLAPGPHLLIIEVSGQKNPASGGKVVTLDYLEVVP